MCPLTVHALLHIAPSMRATGPVWASWEFPTERFCGTLLPAIKSRRFPYASLSNYATEVAQMKQISLIYNLETILALRALDTREETAQYAEHGCACICIEHVLTRSLVLLHRLESNLDRSEAYRQAYNAATQSNNQVLGYALWWTCSSDSSITSY